MSCIEDGREVRDFLEKKILEGTYVEIGKCWSEPYSYTLEGYVITFSTLPACEQITDAFLVHD